MAEVLEVPHLVQQDRMTQVQVRGGGVETGLHPQGAPQLQARLEFFGLDDFVGATADQGKGFCGGQGKVFRVRPT